MPLGRVITFVSLVTFVLVSCSKEEEAPVQVYKKEESKTLRAEGTAENAEEAAQREVDEKLKVEQINAQNTFKRRVLPALTKAKDDTGAIIEALGEFGRLGPAILPEIDKLAKFMTHEDPEVRAAALGASLSIDVNEPMVRLLKAIEDDSSLVRTEALRLWRVRKIDSVTPLFPLLESGDSNVRYGVMQVLLERPEDVDVSIAIEKSLDGFDGPSAKLALKYFAAQPPERAAAVEAIVSKLLDHRDVSTRIEAVRQLGKMNAKRFDNMKILARLIGDDPDDFVAKEAYTLLKAWCGDGVPALDPALDEAGRRTLGKDLKEWLDDRKDKFGGK